MTYYILVFIAYNFVGNPANGDVAISQVSKLPYSFVSEANCEDAFKEIRDQNLTARFAHTCAPVVAD